MQFQHPGLLYALFLLLIPILIHLFQLRRFQKVDFTNVAFLKKVTIQTRKSSQLKKWLTLLMRLLALACIILAFAQPFTASKTAMNSEKETVLYIDNSFSMEAKGANGPLLERAKQQLYDHANGADKISWFSNNNSRKNVSQTDFRNEILSLDYSHNQLSLDEVLLTAGQLFSKSNTAVKRLVMVSDFQGRESFPEIDDTRSVEIVAMEPVTRNNVSIDSVYVLSKSGESTQLNVSVSAQGTVPERIPISLFQGSSLVAKTAVDLSEKTQNSLTFDIESGNGFSGWLQITDPNLQFDNSLYFSSNTPNKIKVMAIYQTNANYLNRLFDQPEYEYTQQSYNEVVYNDIPDQNFIILNELEQLPASLVNSLRAFGDAGGSIMIVPGNAVDVSSYNLLLNALQLGTLGELRQREKKITKINFSHPLYQNVFEKQVTNFQFPKVNTSYNLSSNGTQLLGYEDNRPFLVQAGKHFLSSASFTEENSNFTFSPLIVPTLINMAQQSLPLPELYYVVGNQNTFAVPIKITQDDILTLRDSIGSFIPLQQTKANSVEITTLDDPARSGNYQIEKENSFVESVSYNYPRTESAMRYGDPTDWEGVEVFRSIDQLFESISEENKINSFWKWFVIFAVAFLLMEMFILKFFK
ncbi:MAG: BatA domain-containing protein [Bacteroidota bacterium]